MAKTLSQIRRGLKEVQGPDPKPFGPGPNASSVREEDEVDESHIIVKPPEVGSNQGKIEDRVEQQKATGNQKRLPSTYAEEAIERVKQKMKSNGRTLTGSPSPPVDIKPSNQSLTGYH